MKWNHKCACCDKRATKKWKNIWFCETCYKDVKRHKKAKFVWQEKHVMSIGNLKIFVDVPVKLKNQRNK